MKFFLATLVLSFSLRGEAANLGDVAAKTAQFQAGHESEEILLVQMVEKTNPAGVKYMAEEKITGDQYKLSFHKSGSDIYAYTRMTFGVPESYPAMFGDPATGGKARYQIRIFKSTDGGKKFVHMDRIKFKTKNPAVDQALGYPKYDNWSLYDVHIVYNPDKDNHLLVFECQSPTMAASLCVSESKDPTNPLAWDEPRVFIKADEDDRSAAVGIPIVVNQHIYFKYTVVDDGLEGWIEGNESAYSSYIKVPSKINFEVYHEDNPYSTVGKDDAVMNGFGSEKNPFCKSSWDCNNRDVTDWIQEDGKYYALYNGGNYQRCVRTVEEAASSEWSIGLRVSSNGVDGEYQDLFGPLLSAERNDTCGISYGTFLKTGGETYIYYALDDQGFKYWTDEQGKSHKYITRTHRRVKIKDLAGKPWKYRVANMCSVLMPLRSFNYLQDGNKIHAIMCMVLDRSATQHEINVFGSWSSSYKDIAYVIAQGDEFKTRWGYSTRLASTTPNKDVIWMVWNRFLRRPPTGYETDVFNWHMSRNNWKYMDLVGHVLSTQEFRDVWGAWATL